MIMRQLSWCAAALILGSFAGPGRAYGPTPTWNSKLCGGPSHGERAAC